MVSMSIHHPNLNVSVKDYHDGTEPEFTSLEIEQKDEIKITIFFKDFNEIKDFAGQIQDEALKTEREARITSP